MTTGMTTQKLEGRVSLPRAGLGALLAATLVAGGIIGAAAYAALGDAIPQAATGIGALQQESTVVRDLRIRAGRGQLIGETEVAAVSVTLPRESTVIRDLRLAAGRGPLR